MSAEIGSLKTVAANDAMYPCDSWRGRLCRRLPVWSRCGGRLPRGSSANCRPYCHVRDVLVRAHPVRLVDASDLELTRLVSSVATGAARWLMVLSSPSVSVSPSCLSGRLWLRCAPGGSNHGIRDDANVLPVLVFFAPVDRLKRREALLRVFGNFFHQIAAGGA